MFLKSLELNGFKSFASKTILEFPDGITAIVGPNGSGKSNIIDGIRWLLGERESKNLRGSKSENLIFAGTPKKSRLGMASVGLTFDNSSGFFPVEFKEVVISRRLARDGVSQYFLNKSEVRLKDIVDFFARARLGTKGLTIINQGSSDLFVRASAEERKAMIEEILGLREFQLKKSEAERKLENTLVNLEKVKAMTEEVLPRLRLLKRQTAKFEKRAEVEKELKELEDGYFSFKVGEILDERKTTAPQFEELEKKIIIAADELKILENEVKKIESGSKRHNLNEIRNLKNDLLAKQLKIQKELSRFEAKLEILSAVAISDDAFENREALVILRGVKDGLEKCLASADFNKAAAIIKELMLKIGDFFNQPLNKKSLEINELEKSKNTLIKEISVIEAELQELGDEESRITVELEEFNSSFQKAFEELEKKKDEISGLENLKQKLLFAKERIDLRLHDLEGQLLQASRNLKEFSSLPRQQAGGFQSSADFGALKMDETERRMLKLRGELASIGEIDGALIKEAKETENHYNFLSLQVEDLGKAVQDLKIIIRELKEKIHLEFKNALHLINEKFNYFFRLMFEGGGAKLKLKTYDRRPTTDDNEEIVENNNKFEIKEQEEKTEEKSGIEIEVNLPKKKIIDLEALSGGEKSLISIAALFALIAVSPPPFLVLDEIDAALDEKNSRRFSNLIKDFSNQTQFIIVTHNRTVMEAANVLYGVTMNEDGTSKLLSIKL
ncbi:MAG: AAA family ATPase [Patescibacteria group bacterium]